jgi:hypothetical protein
VSTSTTTTLGCAGGGTLTTSLLSSSCPRLDVFVVFVVSGDALFCISSSTVALIGEGDSAAAASTDAPLEMGEAASERFLARRLSTVVRGGGGDDNDESDCCWVASCRSPLFCEVGGGVGGEAEAPSNATS